MLSTEVREFHFLDEQIRETSQALAQAGDDMVSKVALAMSKVGK